MSSPLPIDATFENLRVSRQHIERFVRSALDVMRKAKKEHGEVFARMGITGTGQAPNYRIEDASGRPLFAIDGANHQVWPEDGRFEGAGNWSTASMSFHDVEVILRSLTGYRGK